jgi:hypothetical protein
MHRSPALLSLTLALGAVSLAACGSSGPDVPTPSSIATPTVAGLPFQYQAVGESSSPTFRVDRAGTYTIAYTIKGTPEQPNCTVSIAMVADDGAVQPVASGEKLAPTDTRQKSVQATLKPGSWRFQEGGGCAWTVTVNAAP